MAVCKSIKASIADSSLHTLANYNLLPCIDCGFCKNNTALCSLDSKDDCKRLFELCDKAKKIVLVSPIYFYHAPASLKAFIDRSQRFWEQVQDVNVQKKDLYAVYIAARTQGEKLSEGLNLTLKYFAPLISAEFKGSICLYGLENTDDFISSSVYANQARSELETFIQRIMSL